MIESYAPRWVTPKTPSEYIEAHYARFHQCHRWFFDRAFISDYTESNVNKFTQVNTFIRCMKPLPVRTLWYGQLLLNRPCLAPDMMAFIEKNANSVPDLKNGNFTICLSLDDVHLKPSGTWCWLGKSSERMMMLEIIRGSRCLICKKLLSFKYNVEPQYHEKNAVFGLVVK